MGRELTSSKGWGWKKSKRKILGWALPNQEWVKQIAKIEWKIGNSIVNGDKEDQSAIGNNTGRSCGEDRS